MSMVTKAGLDADVLSNKLPYIDDTNGQANIDQLHILPEETVGADAIATSDELLPLVLYGGSTSAKNLFGVHPYDNNALAAL